MGLGCFKYLGMLPLTNVSITEKFLKLELCGTKVQYLLNKNRGAVETAL